MSPAITRRDELLYVALTDDAFTLTPTVVQNTGGQSKSNAALLTTAVLAGLDDSLGGIALVQLANKIVPVNVVAIGTEVAIWTPGSSKRFRLLAYHLVCDTAGNVVLRDGLAGTVIAVIPSAAGGSGVYVELGNGIRSPTFNNPLTAQGPVGSALSGVLIGSEG